MYNVWVCLQKEYGWVLTANCSCMAGLGSACSHVAVLLFKIESASHLRCKSKKSSTAKRNCTRTLKTPKLFHKKSFPWHSSLNQR